ncbi:MAG: hypothetical protein KC432_14735, partial [Thermomicrobiales bacterium]|nr:hypothetical protein [Thermomicrobiales bacterium]
QRQERAVHGLFLRGIPVHRRRASQRATVLMTAANGFSLAARELFCCSHGGDVYNLMIRSRSAWAAMRCS